MKPAAPAAAADLPDDLYPRPWTMERIVRAAGGVTVHGVAVDKAFADADCDLCEKPALNRLLIWEDDDEPSPTLCHDHTVEAANAINEANPVDKKGGGGATRNCTCRGSR